MSAEVTIDFSAMSYGDAQEVTSVEQDGITVTFDKGTNKNTPKYYANGTAVRVYGGGTMTVSSTKNIANIAITFGSGDGTNEITTDAGTYADGAWTGSATSVKFTVGGTSGNRRIMKLVVTEEAAQTIPEPYKLFTETTIWIPTAENVTAALAEGWITGCATRADNKKGNIDPATGEETAAKNYPGIGVKKGNGSKTLQAYIAGVDKVIVYGVTGSSSGARDILVTATPYDGGEAVTARATSASGVTAMPEVTLDKNKCYLIDITGVDAADAGQDCAVHGIKFVVSGGVTPPETIAQPTITGETPFFRTTTVTLACETEGASIFYTTDGTTEPTAESTPYTEPFEITATTTVKAIAIKGEDMSAVATKEFIANPTVTTVAELNALANGTAFLFNGEALVVAKQTKTTSKGTQEYVYIKDATGASLIFDNGSTKTEAAVVGKTLTAGWTGKVSVFNGLFELVPDVALAVNEGDAVAVTYDEAQLADVVEANVNKVVTLKGVTYTAPTGANFTITKGEATVAGYNQFGIEIAEPVVGKTYDMVGAIGIYSKEGTTTIQFQPISITKVAEVVAATVEPTEGDIAAAVAAKKAEIEAAGDIMGDVTINLAAGAAYTVGATIETAGSLAINGNGATVDASALEAPFITVNGTTAQAKNANGTENANYKYVENIKIENAKISGLKKAIVRDEQKTLVEKITVENSVIEVAGSSALFDFNGKGYPADLTVNKSTIWSKEGHTGYFLQTSGRAADLDAEKTTFKQATSITNSTLYKVAVGKQLNNLQGKGQKNLVFTLTNSIIAESTQNGNEVRGWLGGQNSTSPVVTYDKNTYWNSGAVQAGWTDSSKQGYDATGTSLITDPTFVNAAEGDFTVFAGTQQAKFQTGDPRWLVAYDAKQALPVDITIAPETGKNIATELATAKAAVDKVGNITINLATDGAYTVNATIEAPADLAINGNGATVDASALEAPFITVNGTTAQAKNANGTENANYKYVENIKIENAKISGLKKAIVRDEQKTLVEKITVENSVIEVAGSSALFDFNGKGYPADLTVNKSTIWSKEGHTGYFLQTSGRAADLDAEKTTFKQATSITNSTLYKVAVGKQLNNLQGKGQKNLVFTLTNSIIAESTQNGNEVRGWLGGQNSTSPVVTYDKNTYWNSGAVQAGWTDSSKQGYDATGTSLITDPTFVNAAEGDFHIGAGTQQAKLQTGDPRWLTEYVPTLDKTALENEITAATTLLGDASTEEGTPGADLKKAIEDAQAALATAEFQEEIDAALAALKAAEDAFRTATGINEITSGNAADNGAWYNLQGVRIEKPTQKGIYIHNGKKVMK